jgi:glycosyltransferase involved in cell wall biosynthesis
VPNGVSFAVPVTSREEKIALRKKLFPGAEEKVYAYRWVLSLARFHKGKGQDVAVDVWRSLPADTRAGTAFFLVGPHTQKDFAQLVSEKVKRADAADHIVLVGPTHQPEEWLRASDVFFSGSNHEGMPLGPLEAAGSGLPVLLSDISGHEFLKPWARYFTLNSPQEGAKQLQAIFSALSEGDKESFDAYWQEAQSLRNTWNDQAMISAYEEILLSLCETHEPAAAQMPLVTSIIGTEIKK